MDFGFVSQPETPNSEVMNRHSRFDSDSNKRVGDLGVGVDSQINLIKLN